MKTDIITPDVTDVVVAVIPRGNNHAEELWDVYIINQRQEPMENVLITSQGYGEVNGSNKTTTVLRHFHQRIKSGDHLKIEPIQKELFGIKNEYWISFNDKDVMLDKRYVFEADQINADNMVNVPGLNRPGVMIS